MEPNCIIVLCPNKPAGFRHIDVTSFILLYTVLLVNEILKILLKKTYISQWLSIRVLKVLNFHYRVIAIRCFSNCGLFCIVLFCYSVACVLFVSSCCFI